MAKGSRPPFVLLWLLLNLFAVPWSLAENQATTGELIRQHYSEALNAFQKGRFQSALSSLSELLEVAPQVAEAHNLMGIIHQKMNRPRLFEESLRTAIELRPDYVEARRNLALHWVRQGRLEPALQQFRKLLDLSPDSSEIRYRMGVIYAELGQFKSAVNYLEAVGNEPRFQSRQYYRLLGECYVALKKPEAAVVSLERANRLGDDSFGLWAALATAYEQTGRLDESVAGFKKARALNPGKWDLSFSLASALFKQGEDESCLAELSRWPESEKNAEYFNLMGAANARLGQVVEAGKSFEKAIELQPRNQESHYNLALLFLRADAYDEAITVLDQSLAHFPESPQLLRAMGFSQQLKGRFEDAQRTFSRLIEIRPSDSSGLLYLASSFLEAGQPEQALSHFERARRLSPEDGRIYYLQGLIHSQRGEEDRALALFDQCLTLDPAFVHALFQRAKILFTRGDLAASLRDSRRAIELDPGFPQAHFQAAQVLARLGRQDEAQAELKTYRELQSKNADKEFRIFKP
ncbi:MAG: tetratricopeptide repeat protein [Acidobacteriota bacterium]|nr:tetratricopeptide repeat protein [Acidobacteriota bacterium]